MNPFVIISLVGLLSAFACFLIARQKDLNVCFWTVLGCLIGPLALPFLFTSAPTASKPH